MNTRLGGEWGSTVQEKLEQSFKLLKEALYIDDLAQSTYCYLEIF
jgi:hypothetical protein